MGKNNKFRNNYKFINNAIVNDETYFDYLERFKKIALSMFEWVNLPSSMNARFLEECLFYNGCASLLYSDKFGFINLKAVANGTFNLYDLPTKLNCFSWGVNEYRDLYIGLDETESIEEKRKSKAILVMNTWEAVPTAQTLELFAYRLYLAQRTCDVNISAQRTPVMIIVDETQRLTMENLYKQYDGNEPFIFGDKNQLQDGLLKAIKTDAPFIADKVTKYKKEIWNEALTFLGVNNINIEKSERVVTDEINANNELINLNLQSFLAPRQEACKQFNELFGLTGTEKEIKVRVRSDLNNIIKQMESIVNDYSINEGEENE